MAKQILWRLGDDYKGEPLDPAQCNADPFVEVRNWIALAVDGGIPTPNAMTLATVDERGRPAARIVLLKEVDELGFVFFTNYDSRKGHDLASHPFAALVMYWEPLDRQIRIEGEVARVDAATSDAYFASRPRGSQLGAIASPQSQVITSRTELEQRVADLGAKLGESAPARPDYWGGYRIVPDMIELWQGQPSRLHDRVRYTRDPSNPNAWTRARLAP